MSTESNKSIVQLAASKVADLWADQLQKPFNKDNGDDNAMLFMLSTLNTQNAQQGIGQSNINAFKASLIKIITEQLSDGRYSQSFFIGTDYHPDQYLVEAADDANIPSGVFPWKSSTNIYIDGNEIQYRFGYSVPYQTIVIQP